MTRSPLFILVAALFLSTSCCLPARLRHGFVHSPRPLWTTDLRGLGFPVNRDHPTDVITALHQIAFGSNTELVVIGDEGPPPGARGKVRAYVLEARTGQVLAQKSWMARGWPSLFATAKGRYVADASDGLVLYSSGLNRILARYDDAVEMASPDGRVVTVWGGVPGRAVTTFLDADTLRPTGAEFINKAVDSIAFDRIAYVAFQGSNAPHASVFIDDAHHEVEPLDSDCREVRPRFISQGALAIFGCNRLKVITDQGQLLFTSPASDTSRWVAPASRNGKRFAVIDTYESAAHWSTVCFERVRVFDSSTGHVIFRAEFHDVRDTLGGSGVALSPDGSLIAVNSLGIVRVFVIPASGDGSD
jgi:hypothetical protein